MKLRKGSVWFFAMVLIALGANAMFLVLIKRSYDSVASAQEHRERALRLSAEFQQDTEQLARLVRAYTSTGEARYLLYYYDILEVREGEKAPPVQADPTSYWDAVIAGRLRHAIPTQGAKRSVVELMKSQGFGPQELAALEQVFGATAAMNKVEQSAFAATQGLYNPQTGEFVSDGQPRLDFASQLVHSADYNALKANQSRAVSDFVNTTDRRTRAQVADADRALERWILLSLISMAATIVLTVLALHVIRRNVLLPIHRLGLSADRLAVGDYATRTGALSGFDELTALGRTVDAMAQSIEGDIAQRRHVQRELERARNQAENATHAKSMFLANMSHEIRTPMNAILGMAFLALKTQLNPRQHDYLSKIHIAARSLLGIINDILDFSKVEAGKLELEIRRFRLEDVASHAIALLRQRAQEKEIELLLDIAEPRLLGEGGALMGDAMRLTQVLTNLLSNAIKFTHHGCVKLKIRIAASDEHALVLQFTVHDTGIGMTQAAIARLFEEFTQADGSTTRQYGGTGLGLTISKRLVELMGGTIWVESEPSRGSTFGVIVPMARVTPPGPPAVAIPGVEALRVLVVDDQSDARCVLMDLLVAMGVGRAHACGVDGVKDGDMALTMMDKAAGEESPYALVLVDGVMPRRDGEGLLVALQARRSGLGPSPVPVVVSAQDSDQLHGLASTLGAHFLPKPVVPDALRELLKRVLGDATVPLPLPSLPAVGPDVSNLAGLRVLLVEDNPINQQLAVELMQARGVQVDVANDGQESIEKVNAASPDHYGVVLMDLQMPVMDGYRATEQLRHDARYVDLPIVAMTAHAMPDERQRCQALGMVGHISKPIDPETLYAVLAEFADAHRVDGPTPHTRMSLPATTDTPLRASVVPDLPGLDTQTGLRHAGGNARLYLGLLHRFTRDYASFPARLLELMDQGKWDEAARVSHSFQGLCATLGARRIAADASHIDQWVQRHHRAKSMELISAFAGACGPFVQALTLYVAQARPGIEESPATTDPGIETEEDWLIRFRKSLDEGDSAACDMWSRRKDGLGAEWPQEVVEQVSAALEVFDYDLAKAIVTSPSHVHGGLK